MSSLGQRESFFFLLKKWSYWLHVSKTDLMSQKLLFKCLLSLEVCNFAYSLVLPYFSHQYYYEVNDKNFSEQKLRYVIFNYSYTFRVYKSGSEGPVLLLLHGGGHSALSWAVFTAAIISRVQCRIVALDLRGHGETKVKNSEDLSAETMAKDVGNVVEAMYGDLPPPIMLIGHSMGGAIAVHTASSNLVPSLLGLCMIDVVEGTAMDALNSMQNFLRGRPKTFKSLENAIEWSVKSGQIRNLESARVSMVGQVKQCEGITSPEGSKSIVEGIIEEEEEDEEGSESVNKRKKEDDMETKKDHPYTWRIELAKTEKYWDGWFRGLSNLFLSCPIPKLLLLAVLEAGCLRSGYQHGRVLVLIDWIKI
uniref:protein phosphatase methylesterase-1 n=1 Tax=Equus caballus TaxID=9796 RepID=F7DPU7_HORSE